MASQDVHGKPPFVERRPIRRWIKPLDREAHRLGEPSPLCASCFRPARLRVAPTCWRNAHRARPPVRRDLQADEMVSVYAGLDRIGQRIGKLKTVAEKAHFDSVQPLPRSILVLDLGTTVNLLAC